MKMKTLAALALATLPMSFQATAEDWYPLPTAPTTRLARPTC